MNDLNGTNGQDPREPVHLASEPSRRVASEMTENLMRAAVQIVAAGGTDDAAAVDAHWPGKQELLVELVDYLLPQRGVFRIGEAADSARELFTALGASLIDSHDTKARDVIIQACMAARQNPNLHHTVTRYVHEGLVELTAIVLQAKSEGSIDPDLSTPAIVLLCQALSFGMPLALHYMRGERYRPDPDEWDALISRLLTAGRPGASTPTQPSLS